MKDKKKQPPWLIRKNNLEDNLWWLYYSPTGKSPFEGVAWAYNFEAAQVAFPRYARKFLEG